MFHPEGTDADCWADYDMILGIHEYAARRPTENEHIFQSLKGTLVCSSVLSQLNSVLGQVLKAQFKQNFA